MNTYYLKRWRKEFRKNYRIVLDGLNIYWLQHYWYPYGRDEKAWITKWSANNLSNIRAYYRGKEWDYLIGKAREERRNRIKIIPFE